MSKKIKLHQIKIVVPHSSIRLQLITGFLVPIIFIIIIGVVSYQKSYEGLTQNYEKISAYSHRYDCRWQDDQRK